MAVEEGRNELAEGMERRLSYYIGPFTARAAVKTFCQRALGRGPETLTHEDLPRVNEALRPMLRTLLGGEQAEVVLERIRRFTGA
jgi:hypothetical protein